MKISRLALLSALAPVTLSAASYAASTTGNVSLTVVTALSVQQLIPMDFGTFSPTGSPGTVNTDGSSSNVTVLDSATPGVFRATGQQGANYNVTGDPTSTLTSGANNMIATMEYPAVPGTLGNISGQSNFLVEGSLAVGANQPAGHYAGTYNVSVNY